MSSESTAGRKFVLASRASQLAKVQTYMVQDALKAAFPDTEVTLDDVVVEADRVVGRFTYRATFRGEFMGMPPTGRPVVMHSIDIWRVVDGMAVEHWDQLDTDVFFAQLAG